MSPVVFRVDPRLVHATLTSAWVPALELEWILVADGAVFSNPRMRHIYEMSAMHSASLDFVEETGLAACLRGMEPMRPGVVLFSSLDAALVAVQSGTPIDLLRISHLPEGRGRLEVQPAVHLGEAERKVIRQLRHLGVRVVVQPLPDDPMVDPGLDSEAEGGNASTLETELEVVNERGLHLRAAHVLADAISALPDEVHIGSKTDLVNAKSLLGLTTLGAGRGTRLRVVVTGPSAAATLDRIRALFASGFTEGGFDPEKEP